MKKRQSQVTRPFPLVEYVIAGFGLIAIVGVLSFLVWEAGRETASPPRIETSLEKITALSPGYVVHVSIKNTGEQTAAQLKLRATLISGEVTEGHELVVDYLPPHSEKMVGLYFANQPTKADLKVIPLSYVEP